MSLKIESDDDTWNWKTVYVPYGGNEKLYDYLLAKGHGLVKMVVSREYVVNLDSAAVDKFNAALYELNSSLDSSMARLGIEDDYEQEYLEYEYSEVTRDEDILFAPTAAPILLK